MSNPAETLTEMGAPNNILTRTAYRVVHQTMYTTVYTGLTVASKVTGKDKLTLLNSLSIKVGLGPVATPE